MKKLGVLIFFVILISCSKSHLNSQETYRCAIINSELAQIAGKNCENLIKEGNPDKSNLKEWLSILKKSKNYETNPWAGIDIAKTLYYNLDLSSFRSSFRPKQQGSGFFSPSNFVYNTVEYKPSELKLVSNSWEYTFSLIAIADFNNDKKAELLVLFKDDAKEGSYNTSELLFFSFSKDRIILCKDCFQPSPVSYLKTPSL